MKRALIALSLIVLGAVVWWSLKGGPGPLPTAGSETTTTGEEPTRPGDPSRPTASNDPTAADAGDQPGPLPMLTGDVHDESGSGIAQANIELRLRGESKEKDCTRAASTTTVAGGSFELGPLCPGQYDLRATRGEAVALAVARLARGVTHERLFLTLREGTQLTVRVIDGAKKPVPGAEVSVQEVQSGFMVELTTDARGLAIAEHLTPRPHSVWAKKDGYLEDSEYNRTLSQGEDTVELQLVAGLYLDGRVVNAEGEGIDEASVMLGTRKKELAGDIDTITGAASKDGGWFSIGPVLPGSYVAVAKHDVYTRVEQPVKVPGPRVTLKLGRGATLDGLFLDADGAPVAAGDIDAQMGAHGGSRRADLDEWGRFKLEGLAKGHWTLFGRAVSTDAGTPEGVAVLQLDVKSEAPMKVTLQMVRGLSITGTCVNDDGTPSDGDVLAVERSVFKRLMLSGFDPTNVPAGSVAFSKCHGTFELEGLKPGAYALVSCGQDEDEPQQVANAGDRGVKVVCNQGRLKFRAVDPAGRPVEKFALFADSPPEDFPDGRYDREEFGKIDRIVSIFAKGFAPLQRRVKGARGTTVDLGELQLTPARKISGRVVDARSGQPVAGAELRFGVDDSEAIVRLRSRKDGSFELPDVPREASSLFVVHPAYRRTTVPVPATGTELTVSLEPGLVITGAVITRDGREPKDFVVEAYGPKGTARVSVDDGRYLVESLEPGDWTLRLAGPDVSAFDPATVTLIGSGSVTHDFVERLGGVRVSVLPCDEEGRPIVALVWLVPGRRPLPSTQGAATSFVNGGGFASEGDPSGEHTFDAVPPGPYTVVVRAKDLASLSWAETVEVNPGMASPLRLVMPRSLAPLPP